ncbi:hypothetical protein DFS33DRAFT_1316779 [Desarmillaria ectypa]|nr:hypothetical protein DFS33DRAFT_1316779 [Desarmillaria ectypa]
MLRLTCMASLEVLFSRVLSYDGLLKKRPYYGYWPHYLACQMEGVLASKKCAVFTVYSTSEKSCMWPQFSNQISSFYSVT